MADKTFTEALAENELVDGTPGINQEAITGEEIVGATSNTALDSGWKFKTLRSWVAKFPDLMLKSVYDTNDDGIVGASGGVNNGLGGSKTATEIVNHIDDSSIHFVINDGATTVSVAWSASKINTELGLKTNQTDFTSHTGDSSIHTPLNDLTTTTSNLWSASKIDSQKADQTDFTNHTGDTSIHYVINDSSTLTTVAWSASKINTELGLKTDQTDFTNHTGTLNIHRVMDDLQTTTTTLWSSSKIDTQKTDQTDFDGHVGDSTHLASNERNAIDAANAPSGTNAFATMNDLGAGNGHVIQDEGIALTQRANLNFVGAGVTVTDDLGNDASVVNITSGGGGEANDGANVGAGAGLVYRDKTLTTLNFKSLAQGSGITITNNADDITIAATGGGGIPEPADDTYGYLREGSTSNQWVRGSRVTEGLVAPTTPSVGDVWIDTT